MHDKQLDLIDTHFHLDLYPNPESITKEIDRKSVNVIAVTNIPSVFWFSRNIAAKSNYINASLGFHPELAGSHAKEISIFLELLSSTRFVGEVGLDYTTKDEHEKALQQNIFHKILDHCATDGNKILNIHSRLATADVISIIGDKFPGVVILHWFSGTLKQLEKALEYGFYFSVNSAMISSKKGQDIIRLIWKNRILTESDGPFVRNLNKPAVPWDVEITINQLAKEWKCSNIKVSEQIKKNFMLIVTPNK